MNNKQTIYFSQSFINFPQLRIHNKLIALKILVKNRKLKIEISRTTIFKFFYISALVSIEIKKYLNLRYLAKIFTYFYF